MILFLLVSNFFELLYRSCRFQSILTQYLKDLLSKLTQLMNNRWLDIQREMILSTEDTCTQDGSVQLNENFYSNECGTYMIAIKIIDTCIEKYCSITLKPTKDIIFQILPLWNTMDDHIKTWFTKFQRSTIMSFHKNVQQMLGNVSQPK